jgi:hypothetical protein
MLCSFIPRIGARRKNFSVLVKKVAFPSKKRLTSREWRSPRREDKLPGKWWNPAGAGMPGASFAEAAADQSMVWFICGQSFLRKQHEQPPE